MFTRNENFSITKEECMKLVSKTACAMSLVGILAASGAYAQGPNPYSDCGIGAALFPKHPVGAVISNVIWDLGTTALTSATASPETCSGEAVKTAAFILESYDSLAEDTARGEGAHLATLLELMDVEEAGKADFVASIRASHADLVNSAEYASMTDVEKAEHLYFAAVAS